MARLVYPSAIIGVIVLCIVGAVLLMSPSAAAQTDIEGTLAPLGTGFTFQGELKDGGSPVSAKCDMQFTLYDAASTGSKVGNLQTVKNINVDAGRFSVILNGGNQFGSNAFVGDARWLRIAVRCPSGSGNYTILSPRQQLTAAPYAIYATTAGSMPWSGLTGLNCASTQIVKWNGAKWVCTAVNAHNHRGQNWIGIGTYGLRVENTSLLDYTSGLTGMSSGVSGKVSGVYGASSSALGNGVGGQSPGVGVYGQTDSQTMSTGVLGQAPQSVGSTMGVFGSSKSSLGTGVLGYVDVSTGSDAVGVYGETSAPGGRGVVGYATHSSGVNVGIFGRTGSPNGYAGYFVGNVYVQGDIAASGAKTFQIDHPLDPDNKWLRHAAVESPAMMNMYNENIILDGNGEAWVQLPDYFEALNKDFRYQLTPIGAPGPNLFIAEPIANNRFKIAGGTPNSEVSWQVTGIRQDSYANAHPLIVEEEKATGVNGASLQQPVWSDSDRSSVGAWLDQMEYPTEGQSNVNTSDWEEQ